MPRPHYPTTGGPHLPSWNMREARQRHRPQTVTPPAAKHTTAVELKTPVAPAMPATVSKRRKDTSNNRSANLPHPTLPPAAAAPAMLWTATFLSIAALLFTVLVLLHHG